MNVSVRKLTYTLVISQLKQDGFDDLAMELEYKNLNDLNTKLDNNVQPSDDLIHLVSYNQFCSTIVHRNYKLKSNDLINCGDDFTDKFPAAYDVLTLAPDQPPSIMSKVPDASIENLFVSKKPSYKPTKTRRPKKTFDDEDELIEIEPVQNQSIRELTAELQSISAELNNPDQLDVDLEEDNLSDSLYADNEIVDKDEKQSGKNVERNVFVDDKKIIELQNIAAVINNPSQLEVDLEKDHFSDSLNGDNEIVNKDEKESSENNEQDVIMDDKKITKKSLPDEQFGLFNSLIDINPTDTEEYSLLNENPVKTSPIIDNRVNVIVTKSPDSTVPDTRYTTSEGIKSHSKNPKPSNRKSSNTKYPNFDNCKFDIENTDETDLYNKSIEQNISDVSIDDHSNYINKSNNLEDLYSTSMDNTVTMSKPICSFSSLGKHRDYLNNPYLKHLADTSESGPSRATHSFNSFGKNSEYLNNPADTSESGPSRATNSFNSIGKSSEYLNNPASTTGPSSSYRRYHIINAPELLSLDNDEKLKVISILKEGFKRAATLGKQIQKVVPSTKKYSAEEILFAVFEDEVSGYVEFKIMDNGTQQIRLRPEFVGSDFTDFVCSPF